MNKLSLLTEVAMIELKAINKHTSKMFYLELALGFFTLSPCTEYTVMTRFVEVLKLKQVMTEHPLTVRDESVHYYLRWAVTHYLYTLELIMLICFCGAISGSVCCLTRSLIEG